MEKNVEMREEIDSTNKSLSRIKWIDACKGFAIFLVVVGHVADGYIRSNIFENYNNGIILIHSIIYSFHMALFFLISGYTFKIAYLKEERIKKNKIKTQLINIFIIFTIFTILQWVVKYMFKNVVNTEFTVHDLLLMYIKPMAPYWYLWDLFIFYIIGVLIYKYKDNQRLIIGILFLSTIICSVIFWTTSVFWSIFKFLLFLLCFIMGIFWDKIKKDNFKLIISILGICSYNIANIICNNEIINHILYVINTLSIVYIIIYIFSKIPKLGNSKILNYLGQHSLEIYVLHCFFTAFNRTIFIKLGINNFYINFILNCIVSTLIPILCSIICKKLKIYKYIFTPGKVIQSRKEEK